MQNQTVQTQTINGHPVTLLVTGSDGSPLEPTLSARELWTVQAALRMLEASPAFQEVWSDAQLTRVEVQRGLSEREQGRCYLRLEGAQGATEFWVNLSRKPSLDLHSGLIGVVVKPETPPVQNPAEQNPVAALTPREKSSE